ncbi:MAG: tetratricopeptide repeat protein [Sandaracinaceae bacterium]|nr:tetratricopeptide repeat protein [Sandaracinaceae bacterium]
MSFLKKLFGGASFGDEMAAGDAHAEAGRHAEARAAYERALDAARDDAERARARERVDASLDALARERIAEAESLARNDALDLAAAELQNAMELAASSEVKNEARRRLETLEQEDAKRSQADVPDEMSDEDRWALLAGSWGEEQLEEYDEYGEPFREALLALHDGDAKEARDGLQAILDEYEDSVYLWLELGRAKMLCEDWDGAEEALRTFLEALDEDEGGPARMSALANLAGLRDRAGDEDGAIAMLEAALDAFPEEPGAFLMMGRFLFDKGHAQEAADVLAAGAELLDTDRPDWRYLELLGLAHAEAGDDEQAALHFDRVIAFFVSLRSHDRPLDYPPQTALRRAAIHEAAGELEKAADLYRTLASGSDVDNHLKYHREAARVLLELELDDEARRMLTRALALAEGDEEVQAEIEAQLAELE